MKKILLFLVFLSSCSNFDFVYEKSDQYLLNNTIYSYRVRAHNASGYSAWTGDITQSTNSGNDLIGLVEDIQDTVYQAIDPNPENIILIVNIISALILVVVILLQKSEGGALGLGVSQESFVSSRSAGSFLTKTTAIVATLFIITSISLTIISKDEFSSTSVLEKIEKKDNSTEPEVPKSD